MARGRQNLTGRLFAIALAIGASAIAAPSGSVAAAELAPAPAEPPPASTEPLTASPPVPVPAAPLSKSELDLFQLEEQVAHISSVTKTEQTAEEAPAIVDVVTRAQIREWGYQSVAEVLRHVVGFYVEDDHILPNVAVRGFSGGLFAESSIIKVMLDGQSLSFRPTSGNWLGPEAIPISVIERIEIIRGPASALYGADAQTAVGVSLLAPGKPGSDLDLSVGARRGQLDVVIAAGLQPGHAGGKWARSELQGRFLQAGAASIARHPHGQRASGDHRSRGRLQSVDAAVARTGMPSCKPSCRALLCWLPA